MILYTLEYEGKWIREFTRRVIPLRFFDVRQCLGSLLYVPLGKTENSHD